MNNNYYWEDKQNRAKVAIYHTEYMANYHYNDTVTSVQNSIIYDDLDVRLTEVDKNDVYQPKIEVIPVDTVSALYFVNDINTKVAVLNFASYKNPGGKFIEGSRAQEECLCHESNLYNVLSQFQDSYYNPNHKTLNHSLYTNRMIYSPNILFEKENQIRYADVITCAAPNITSHFKYSKVPYEWDYIRNLIEMRITNIVLSAWVNKVDILILGAWGCGVFGNDPLMIAQSFKKIIDSIGQTSIKNYVFAIPYREGSRDINSKKNYMSFYNIFKGEGLLTI